MRLPWPFQKAAPIGIREGNNNEPTVRRNKPPVNKNISKYCRHSTVYIELFFLEIPGNGSIGNKRRKKRVEESAAVAGGADVRTALLYSATWKKNQDLKRKIQGLRGAFGRVSRGKA